MEGPSSQDPNDLSLNTLPSELQNHIAGYLPIRDLVSFRLTSRGMDGAGQYAISHRLNRHPDQFVRAAVQTPGFEDIPKQHLVHKIWDAFRAVDYLRLSADPLVVMRKIRVCVIRIRGYLTSDPGAYEIKTRYPKVFAAILSKYNAMCDVVNQHRGRYAPLKKVAESDVVEKT